MQHMSAVIARRYWVRRIVSVRCMWVARHCSGVRVVGPSCPSSRHVAVEVDLAGARAFPVPRPRRRRSRMVMAARSWGSLARFVSV